jgi:hypothetical protein
MKRFATILVAIAALLGAGIASAQMHGGHGGGGAWHGGGGFHGGGFHGGGFRGGGFRGHGGVIIGFGGPWWGWWPGYYSYPYPYPYPYPYSYYGPDYYGPDYYDPGVYDSGTYVQRPEATSPEGAVTSDGYAYYCPNPAGYYPQVKTCAAGWLRVVPQGAPAPTPPEQQ